MPRSRRSTSVIPTGLPPRMACYASRTGYPTGMDDSYPKRLSDPAAEGLPEYADDDSTAYDDVQSPRESDGPDPFALPKDRDAEERAVDDFGTTAEEQRLGEPLESRLAREQPDLTPDSVALDPDPLIAFEAVGESAAAQVPEDTALLAEDEQIDPHLGSPVSMYDRPEPGVPDMSPVGRLVRPGDSAHEDAEGTEIAMDEGAAGGGASAEELAMHPIPPQDLEQP